MENFDGYMFAKLDRIGSKMEGPEYLLQQSGNLKTTTDTPTWKKVEAGQIWKKDPVLHKYLAQKVAISGTLKEKNIQYEEIRKE